MKSIKNFVKEHKEEVIVIGTTAIIVGGIATIAGTRATVKSLIKGAYCDMDTISILSSTMIDMANDKVVLSKEQIDGLMKICAESTELKLYIMKHYPKLIAGIKH